MSTDPSAAPSLAAVQAVADHLAATTVADEVDDNETEQAETEPGLSPEEIARRKAANKKKRDRVKQKRKEMTAVLNAGSDTPNTATFSSHSMHAFFNGTYSLRLTGTRGRHVVATEDTPAGTTVFEAPAYAAVVADALVEDYCHHCLQRAYSTFKCSTCEHVRWCSTECAKAMASVHDGECAALKQLKEAKAKTETKDVRLLIRILNLKWQQQGGTPNPTDKKVPRSARPEPWKPSPGCSWEDVNSLISHIDQFDDATKEQTKATMEVVSKIVDAAQWIGVDAATKLYFQIMINSLPVRDERGRTIGLAMILPAAYMNHSCVPNCIYFYNSSGAAVVRTVREVKKGEELTYAYVDLYQSKEDRAKQLKSIYHINHCYCSRCEQPETKTFDHFLSAYQCRDCTTADNFFSELPLDKESVYTNLKCDGCGHEYGQDDINLLLDFSQIVYARAVNMAHKKQTGQALDLLEEKLIELQPKKREAGDEKEAKSEDLDDPTANAMLRLHPYHASSFGMFVLLLDLSYCHERHANMIHYCYLTLEGMKNIGLNNHPEMTQVLLLQAAAYYELYLEAKEREKKKAGEELDRVPPPKLSHLTVSIPTDSAALYRLCMESFDSAIQMRGICYGSKHASTRLALKEKSACENGRPSIHESQRTKPANPTEDATADSKKK